MGPGPWARSRCAPSCLSPAPPTPPGARSAAHPQAMRRDSSPYRPGTASTPPDAHAPPLKTSGRAFTTLGSVAQCRFTTATPRRSPCPLLRDGCSRLIRCMGSGSSLVDQRQIRRGRSMKLEFGAADLKSEEQFYKRCGEIAVGKIPQKISLQ